MPVLTDYQVAHYRDHGWVAPVDVLAADEATALHRALVDAEQAFPDDLHAGHRNNAHLVLPFLADLAIHEVILDCVRSLVDDPRSLLNSVLFIKEPGSDAYVSWHQDSTYMGLDSSDMVTAWVALTASTTASGCVAMVPGSHSDGIRPHVDRYGAENILTRGQHVDVDVRAAVEARCRSTTPTWSTGRAPTGPACDGSAWRSSATSEPPSDRVAANTTCCPSATGRWTPPS